MKRDLIQITISEQLQRCKQDLVFYALLCVLSIAVSLLLSVYIMMFTSMENDRPSYNLLQTGVSLFGIGFAGFLGRKVFSIRSELRRGEVWLSSYAMAVGPPPNEHVDHIRQRALTWLEGSEK